jgi:CRISPR-associated helicase Cas3
LLIPAALVGSRLHFSGYGVGFKGRPLHAGFLGQDVFLIHDEANLEPAFQDLLRTIEGEQARCREYGKFRGRLAIGSGRFRGFGLIAQMGPNP